MKAFFLKNRYRTYVLYFFLFNLPLTLYFNKENMSQVYLSNILNTFFYHSFFFIFLIFILFFLIKIFKQEKNQEISLFTFFLVYFLSFFYSDLVNQVNIFLSEFSLKQLKIFLVIFYCVFFIFLYGLLLNNKKIVHILKIFISIYLVVNYLYFSQQILTVHLNNKTFKTEILNKEIKRNDSNIYYILFDGMSSLEIAEKYGAINKAEIIKKELTLLNATYIEKSISNYSATYLSIASIFDLNYPINSSSKKYKNRLNFFPSMISNNKININLFNLLKSVDKKFYWIGNNWGGCVDVRKDFTINCKAITNKSLSILENFYTSSPLSLLNNLFTVKSQDRELIKNTNKYIKDIKDTNSFYFFHLMIPHDNVVDKNCNYVDVNISKVAYKDQYACSIKKIYELINNINQIDKNEKVIILSSDHGNNFIKNNNLPFVVNGKLNSKRKKEFYERSQIINIISSPARCNLENLVNDVKSPINNVRFAFNCIHNMELEYLDNKHYKIFYENEKHYGNAFEINR